ncbi:S9 family peptidase [Segetibacter koreensis]|uniref:S9 family peptidase n=1 Tax=Segetibacter koreensis TaxID=398037 RepID=UPI00036213CE|nr:S9 family peptidase [Segetibacter koreensis]
MKRTSFLFSLLVILSSNSFSQATRRHLVPGDVYRIQTLSDANISPDGQWIAYTVSSIDSAKDKRNTDIWMVSLDGKQTVQLTSSPDNESNPRWSPDGKYISFTAARPSGGSQVWLLDRRGGEGVQLTNAKGDLNSYSWSPDGKKLALVMKDPKDTSKTKPPEPYIINKFRFKQDITGYQSDTSRTHLYLFDVASKKITQQLTSGIYSETDPTWSPDGTKISFVSNRTEDPDRNENTDIWIMDITKGAVAKKLTTWNGGDSDPQWSPDGKTIAYVRTTSDATFEMYDQTSLYIINANGGEPKPVTLTLDRPVTNPRWSRDGKSIAFLVADNMQRYVSSYDVAKGTLKTIARGDRSFSSIEAAPKGNWVAFMSEPQLPSELFAIEGSNVRRLTTEQNEFIDSIALATVEKFTSKSKDGTLVSGLIYYPPGMSKEKMPLIFYIHGGPAAQDEFTFDLTRQMFAAHGYAVAAVNYRGSLGRGIEFSRTISGNWGNKEVMDILGAADYLVAKGVADSARMGISGWSYGGILTDYTIASDTRFKVASSGAGVAAPLSLYGVDQYINQYVNEIGLPWKDNNIEKYLKLSYPFLHADRIKTPTQFMVGEKDFNVPAVGSEQMYQALRSLDIPTELLIYPGQYHGFTQPSFIKDRFERYFAWFDKYLKPLNKGNTTVSNN